MDSLRFLTGALVMAASTSAIAVNCDKNPSHPNCGGGPEPEPNKTVVMVDDTDQYIGTPFDNGLTLFRGFDGHDGAYELLFSFSNGSVSASGPTYFTDQDCGLSGGGAYVDGSNGSRFSRGTGFGTGDDIYLATAEAASPPNTIYSSYIESTGAECRNGSGTRLLIPAVKASLSINYPVRYDMR